MVQAAVGPENPAHGRIGDLSRPSLGSTVTIVDRHYRFVTMEDCTEAASGMAKSKA